MNRCFNVEKSVIKSKSNIICNFFNCNAFMCLYVFENNDKHWYVCRFFVEGDILGKDIRIMIGDVKFRARAVGVIRKNNKILFQQRVGDDYWALPGGAIGTLERSKDVVVRELEEEIGLKDVKVIRPLWFVEYFFKLDGVTWHQYIIGHLIDIFDEEIINKDIIKGIEKDKNIIYKWIDIQDIKNSNIKPNYLKEKLIDIKDEFEYIEEEDL